MSSGVKPTDAPIPAPAPQGAAGARRPALKVPARSRGAKLLSQLDAAGPLPPAGQGRALPRALRLRLTVTIPLVVTFLVVMGGLLALWISYPFFANQWLPPSPDAMELRVMTAFGVVACFALVSLLVALRLARSIATPLRAFATQVQSLSGTDDGGTGAAGTELDVLGSALEGVMDSVSSLRLDSYTLHSLEGGVITMGPEGIVTSFNAVAEGVFLCRGEDVIGRPLRDVLPTNVANRAFLEGIDTALSRTVHFSSAEALVVAPDGHTLQLGYSLSPLRDEAGGSLGVVLTFKDLEERKVAEQRMRRTESLALIGAMATNVAHEIRNPLGAMSGLVEMIRDGSDANAPGRRYAARILESIDRINRICQELLTVGNPEPHNVEPLDINALARKTIEFSRYDAAASEHTTVRTRYAADLPRVTGDGERLGQVLLNILRNAYQACKDDGEVTLTTRNTDRGVAIAVHNTGPHIPREEISKLFTVFYTTKKRGTGLGLAISQQLVRAHGGRILVDSGPDCGTTFTIELPLMGPAPVEGG
ncbi:MAG: PAS domain-containing protein [Candidatus Brocadiae bacterium]|nr:PAS domain-containing protein [Candidatus Brocadiia bacterium]